MFDYIEEQRIKNNGWSGDTIRIIDKKTKAILFEWNDDANIDCPEDLTWSRMIGDLFNDVFKIGFKYGKHRVE